MGPYVAHRFRLANHVGGVRKRLAKAITQAFANEGITIICEPENLWPALGVWKQNRMDVMRWEGSIAVWRHGKWQRTTICSWDRMTECLKGFKVYMDNFAFELSALDEKVSPAERYVCELEADQYHKQGTPVGNPYADDRETRANRKPTP